MANGTLQNLTKDFELYVRFIVKLAALVGHRFIMKPTGNIIKSTGEIIKPTTEIIEPTTEIIKHWTSWFYAVGDHVYHFVHSVSNILIPLFLSLLLIRVSYKIVISWLQRPDGSPGYLLLRFYQIPSISSLREKHKILRNFYEDSQ